MGLPALTGTWAVRAALVVPKRTELDAPLAVGGEPFLHFILVHGVAIWAVARIARRVRLRPAVATVWRVLGWLLAAVFLVANAQHSGVAGGNRDLFLAATTEVVPLWSTLAGALLFDLALLLSFENFPKPLGGFDPPASAVCAGLYGGLAPVAFVGVLAWASMGQEFFVPPLFEALTIHTLYALPLFLLATPAALIWALVGAVRGAGAKT